MSLLKMVSIYNMTHFSIQAHRAWVEQELEVSEALITVYDDGHRATPKTFQSG
jgi:hypothetical protein